MEKVEIYRPWWGRVLNPDAVLKFMLQSQVLGLKTWLRRNEASLPVRLLLQSRDAARRMINTNPNP
jgi:hypothetical protein